MAVTLSQGPGGTSGGSIFELDVILVYQDTFGVKGDSEVAWPSEKHQKGVYEEATHLFSHVGESHEFYDEVSFLFTILKPRNYPETFERAFHHSLGWRHAATVVLSMNNEVFKLQENMLRAQQGVLQRLEAITGALTTLTTADSSQASVPECRRLKSCLADLARERIQNRHLRHVQMEHLPAEISPTPGNKHPIKYRIAKTAAIRQLLEDFANLFNLDKNVVLTAVLEKWLFPAPSVHFNSGEEMMLASSLHRKLQAHLKFTTALNDKDLCVIVSKSLDGTPDEEKLSMLASVVEIWVESELKSIGARMGESLWHFVVEVEKCSLVSNGDAQGPRSQH